MPRKLLFVLNPLSGGKSRKKEELPAIFENFCKENHFEFFLYKTTGHEDQKQILQMCREHHLDCVVAVGGDGTVNMVGEVLVSTHVPLAIIPMGSANGLARDLNIPEDLDKALHLIKEFHIHAIDSLKVNGRNCFHVSDFGFNARIVRRFQESIMRGKISYIWYGLLEFFLFEPFQYTIQTNEHQLEGQAFMILEDLQAVPSDQWKSVSYETLTSDPVGAIQGLCDFAGAEFDERARSALAKGLPLSRTTVSQPDPRKWEKYRHELDPVLPSTEATVERIRKIDSGA